MNNSSTDPESKGEPHQEYGGAFGYLFSGLSDELPRKPSLLQTKLHVPISRHKLINRPRLIEQLQNIRQYTLSLICAPAGYGKTTLLGEWASACDFPVGWVSLDPGDNDLLRFWSYLIASLQSLREDLCQNALSLLQSHPLGVVNTDLFLTSLVNELSEHKGDLGIVLDDYHAISSEAIQKTLSLLIDHAPPNLHLVIASRSSPPFPLAQWRTRDKLFSLAKDALQFTVAEISKYFRELNALDLPTATLALILEKTEGWIAGLKLISSTILDGSNPYDYLQNIKGTTHLIAGYLSEEVLKKQRPEIQSFLIRTSIFERLDAKLCASVMGIPEAEAQKTLEQLESDNLFIVSLDDEYRWFRYHPLFVDFLQNRLHKYSPEMVPELFRRASRYFEQTGELDDALQLAVAAHEVDRAARIIEQNYETLVVQGGPARLLNWIEALPKDIVQSNPRVCLARAWSMIPLNRLEDAKDTLTIAEQGVSLFRETEPATLETQSTLGEIATVRTLIETLQYNEQGIIAQAQEALKLLPGKQRFFRGLVGLCLGVASYLSWDLPAARNALLMAIQVHLAEKHLILAFLGRYYLAEVASLEGELHYAAELLDEALKTTQSIQGVEQPIAGLAHISLSKLFYEWNDLDSAEKHALKGLDLSKNWWVTDAVVEAYLVLSRVEQARGNNTKAINIYRQTLILKNWKPEAPFITHLANANLKLWIHAGCEDKILRWIEAEGLALLPSRADGSPRKESQDAMRICTPFLVAQEKWYQAQPLLEASLQHHEAHGCKRWSIEDLVLLSLVNHGLGDVEKALACLTRALSLAETQGFIRVFIDEGESMITLLKMLQERNISREYVDTLLEAWAAGEHYLFDKKAITNLSDREMQVLRLVALGLSPDEVSQQLIVSVGTVRNHLKNIYSKLHVHGRVRAIQSAREIGLLK